VLQLAYLADIFSHLNDLNISLQEHDKSILLIGDEVNPFIKKLYIWVTCLAKRNVDPLLLTFKSQTKILMKRM
jgi:hypothetical protein